jgi:PhoD-like phosphatase, N-terminal domain/PhoD-like phosphatase
MPKDPSSPIIFAGTMKCIASAIAVTAWLASIVSGHVPSAEMGQAKSVEELLHLEDNDGHFVDKAGLRRANEQRRLQASQPLLAGSFGGTPGFYHGVASGDPLPTAVIVWTRYTPTTPTAVITLELRIAAVDPAIPVNDHLDPAKNPNLKRAKIEATGASDWVAKVDVTGLKPSTNYVYAFSDGTRVSDVGQTRTAPRPDEDVSQLQYAVFSCSNYGNGWFHSYDVASTIKDLDFWVHVGDYIVSFAGRCPGFYHPRLLTHAYSTVRVRIVLELCFGLAYPQS